MRICVTGGTSFIGVPLVKRLLSDGHQVRVLDHHHGRSVERRLKDATVDVSCGDIRDPHAVSRAVFGCESVIHLAYAPVSAEPRDIMDVAINGMANVLRACELHGIADLMLVSSSRAETDRSYYGIGKLSSEMMIASRKDSFKRAITARVFNAYGPDMGVDHVIPQFILRMLDRVNAGLDGFRFPIKGSGCDRRSFVYIDDCTEQLAALYRHGSPGASVYDVGDPTTETAIGDLARMIAAALNVEAELIGENVDHRLATTIVPNPPALLTNGMPRTRFTEGLARTIEWYKEHQREFA